jgi:hypothetical protein
MGKPANVSSTPSSSLAAIYDLGVVPPTKLRPWLQDFDLGPAGVTGTIYTTGMVRQEKQAVYDTLDTATSSQYYGGWMLWNAANNYTAGALDPK